MSARSTARRRSERGRIGRVSFYFHHGAWWVYYRDGDRQVRRRVGAQREDAERLAAQVNAQLASDAPTSFDFRPITIAELGPKFLADHELVLHSSLATINRYRAALQHLIGFAAQAGCPAAHQLDIPGFVRYLRHLRVSPNGHPNTTRRPLRDKGLRFILLVARSLYSFAARQRHLPPYAKNPFTDLKVDRLKVEDSKPVFVFDANQEHSFFETADRWAFPIHLLLAKAGLRPGELTHLLVEDLDLDNGWLHICNKPELGWRIKTGAERRVPLIPELGQVLRRVIGQRVAGPVFVRPRFVPAASAVGSLDRLGMASALTKRVDDERCRLNRELTRVEEQKLARRIWVEAGVVKVDAIRRSYMQIMAAIGLPHATCPKSWRHTFATLLQDANVDPLIRQITLGHQPANAAKGSLGMTGVYTHTRPETQRREVERALRLWPRTLELAPAWATKHS